MFRLLIVVSIRVRNFLRRYMPTNILADAIRARRGMKLGPAVMLLAVPYFAAAVWLAGLIDQGAPGWLHLLVLLTIWNGFKMLWLGPASVAWLTRARLREAGARRRQRRAAALSSGSTV
ncbi:sulfate permease [Rhodococcus sp. HNM0569]|uniref:sulfate permease n=1 Tax=Rhodococcus sp. HNM0569 TaxID=2716340 RepID=UPI00146BD80F|nr:sulfate permease [Rhodococcus sp. HNM0569]NLU83001.1 sulfate permease [Rhodococcus sp. HNM0569]